MTFEQDLALALANRKSLNNRFAQYEVKLSKEAAYEQHSEITSINSRGEWETSVPGGGRINRVRNHSNSALKIGGPMHLSKNTGISSVDQQPTVPTEGFTNPQAEESISVDIPSDFPAKALQDDGN